MQTAADRIYCQFIDHLERLEMAVYDACGANVGPEEFDECAARASKAARALRDVVLTSVAVRELVPPHFSQFLCSLAAATQHS